MKGKFTLSANEVEPMKIDQYDGSFFENQIMKVDDLAGYLQLSSKTIYRMAQRREIPAIRVGRSYRFLFPDILQWAKSRGNYGKNEI